MNANKLTSETMIITFGTCHIDATIGIICTDDSGCETEIPKESLWDLRNTGAFLVYDWMIHLTEKNWFTPEVANDFNQAFIYAQVYFRHLKPKNLPDVSMEYSISVQKSYMSHKDIKSFSQLFPNIDL